MKTLYLDCQCGIAGDMTVAALLDLGLPLEHLRSELTRISLPVTDYHLTTEQCQRLGMTGRLFDVQVSGDQPHRHYGDIDAMIATSSLSDGVKATARKVFRRLAEAEAKVHGVPLEKVHFHEVGAVDSIIDIVATAIGLEYLHVERICCSPLPLGSGFIETAHGLLPVPAPATAELLQGLPVHSMIGPGERVTPTGAAIVAALADGFTLPTDFRLDRIGHGAGSRDFPDTPNILRAFLGAATLPVATDQLSVMEANIDDATPEILGFAMERLFAEGALDVWFTPIQMKKNRPAVTISLLIDTAELARFAELVLAETPAIGLRHYPVARTILERRLEERDTPLGKVRFKVTRFGAKPEFDDCRRLALETGLALREVYRRLENGE
ncbi:MAG: nickel pincer cofactor biosynthesis protein LarC [Geobacter sp.]|nr:nickel pincer cofactor biosynthesis protein LarC [Geobacter sp.]